MSVPTGGEFQLPELSSTNGVTVRIGQGGTLEAPQWTEITGSLLHLGANQTLGAPRFENIDNSRFYLTGGVGLGLPERAGSLGELLDMGSLRGNGGHGSGDDTEFASETGFL